MAVYPFEAAMLSRDGVTLTSEALSPYLDFMANSVEELLVNFESRRLPQPEIVLGDSSELEMVPKTPAGAGFDSSLTLLEAYSMPQATRDPPVRSGVSDASSHMSGTFYSPVSVLKFLLTGCF